MDTAQTGVAQAAPVLTSLEDGMGNRAGYYPKSIIEFDYKGDDDKVYHRVVQPSHLSFRDMGWSADHEFGWVLNAFDCIRGVERDFRIDINMMTNLEITEPSETGYDDELIAVICTERNLMGMRQQIAKESKHE
jgi:hypothetical protein